MSKHIPPVQKYMSTTPLTIAPSASLAQANQLMQEHGIRHLPVTAGDKLVGLISLTDLRVVEGIVGIKPEQIKLEDIMQRAPFACQPDSPLDTTVDEMVAHKWGCAVVVDHQRVVGIFTSIDAMRALVELARTRLAK